MALPTGVEEPRSPAPAPGRRRRLLLRVGVPVLVLVLVAAAAVVGLRWWQARPHSELERAVAMLPSDTARWSWTDWAGVRADLRSDVDADTSVSGLQDFLDAGYDADLTSESAMGDSADVLQREFGVSPATVDWELLAQSTQGAVLALGLPDSLDVGDLADRLEGLGYQRPDQDAESGAVWQGGPDLVATIAADAGGSLSPQFQHLALDADAHLLFFSDNAVFLRDAVRDRPDRIEDDGVRDVVRAVDEPLSAAVYTGAQSCQALAMAQADDDDQAAADQLVARAGDVDPLTGFAMAAEPDGTVRVGLAFETDEQARTNADSRARLASGPAPGQGGDFSDRFTLGPVTADGRTVTLDLDPVDDSPVLSDLSTGPVLFATC